LEEGFDFGKQDAALFVPLGGAAQDQGAFTQAGETDFLGSGGAQVAEFHAQGLEECEFKTISRFETVTGGASGSSFSAIWLQPIFTSILRMRS
jgi:hypothetical protein